MKSGTDVMLLEDTLTFPTIRNNIVDTQTYGMWWEWHERHLDMVAVWIFSVAFGLTARTQNWSYTHKILYGDTPQTYLQVMHKILFLS
jgi:hypothetical protein